MYGDASLVSDDDDDGEREFVCNVKRTGRFVTPVVEFCLRSRDT